MNVTPPPPHVGVAVGVGEGDEGATFRGMELLFSGQLYQAVAASIELNLFDIISEAGGPISPSDIALQLKSSNPNAPQMINRLLQLLASYNIVSFSSSSKEENMYGPTPVSKLFLNKEGSLAATRRFSSHAAFHNSWLYMKDVIINGGIPFEKANGVPFYQYLDTDPVFHEIFFKGMTSRSQMATKMIVESYKGFEGLSSLVDVGGAQGFALNMIISKYPNIKGINYDLPHVVAHAPSYPGIEHVMGDMFVSVPKADAIFLKAVIHNWNDEDCIKLLKNCYDAIPESGKVIISERLLPAVPENASAASKCVFHLDCLMMSHHNGRERTEKELKELATAAGFQSFRVDTRARDFYVMELLKINNASSQDKKKVILTPPPHVGIEGATFMGMELLFSGQLYQAVATGIDLNLFDIISEAGGPISPSDIALQLKSSNPNAPQMINRLLQLLASYNIVSFSSSSKEENMYGPTPVSKLFLNKEGSLAGASHFTSHAAFLNGWSYMKDAIINGGIPFEKANGMPFYQYLDTDPVFHEIFFKGVTSRSKNGTRMMVEAYKGFKGLSSLVDVGGAHGFALNMIISKYPNIKGINFDLPHIIAAAPSYPGIEHVMGDMFVSVPKAEAIFLKAILHNWSDEDCVKLLKNCYNSIPESGKVIVAERLRPAVPENASPESRCVYHLDCLMLCHQTGRERTEKEFKQLATAAGFHGFRVVTHVDFYVMELLKINA